MTIIQYQGRPAQRESSEQRRRAILDAALAIIVRDGIRNVRHRAVAKEAGVPLSATTYYFKDISDLILDCFTLFAEQAMESVVRPVGEALQSLITTEIQQPGFGPARIPLLLDNIASLIADYMHGTLETSRHHLIAEQAFLQEATLDPRLRPLAAAYVRHQIDVVVPLCELLGIKQPEQVASLVWSSMMQMELRLLIDDDLTRDDTYGCFKVLLLGLLGDLP